MSRLVAQENAPSESVLFDVRCRDCGISLDSETASPCCQHPSGPRPHTVVYRYRQETCPDEVSDEVSGDGDGEAETQLPSASCSIEAHG